MGYRVLIVDDEAIIRAGLKVKIDWLALGVDALYEASDGIDAVKKAMSYDPDIVITDIKMPGMNGLSLVEEISRHKPECKFILVSGYAEFEYAKKALILKVEAYLLKPVGADELKSTIMKIIASLNSEVQKQDSKQTLRKVDQKEEQLRDNNSLADLLTGRRKVAYQVKEYIDRNYSDKELDLKSIAKNCYLTTYYIRRSFKVEFDTNVTEYIANVRMQHVMELIEKNDNLKLSSLCHDVGFRDASYFSKCFKKHYGMSPREYIAGKR